MHAYYGVQVYTIITAVLGRVTILGERERERERDAQHSLILIVVLSTVLYLRVAIQYNNHRHP